MSIERDEIDMLDFIINGIFWVLAPVSYTHLDVYKRQAKHHYIEDYQKEDLQISMLITIQK